MKIIEQTQQKLTLKHISASMGVGIICFSISLMLWISLIFIYPSSAQLSCSRVKLHDISCKLKKFSYTGLREQLEVNNLLSATAIKKPGKNGEHYRIVLKTANEAIELLPFPVGSYLENQEEANKINDFTNQISLGNKSFYYSDPITNHLLLPLFITLFSFFVIVQTNITTLDFDKVSSKWTVQWKSINGEKIFSFSIDEVNSIEILQRPVKRKGPHNYKVILNLKDGKISSLVPDFSLERIDAVKLKKVLQDFLSIS